MLVTRSRTCYQLDGVLIKQGTSTYWHHVQGEHLSWGRNGWGGRAEQAVCQHLPIWPAFVFRRQTLLSGSHLRNHAMVIRHNPIKKSNQREYIIIEMIFIWEGRKRPTVERRQTRKQTEVRTLQRKQLIGDSWHQQFSHRCGNWK